MGTSLGSIIAVSDASGATSIYRLTANGFRIYVRYCGGTITPELANQRGWHLNWHAPVAGAKEPESCIGQSIPGNTAWQAYGSNGLYVDPFSPLRASN